MRSAQAPVYVHRPHRNASVLHHLAEQLACGITNNRFATISTVRNPSDSNRLRTRAHLYIRLPPMWQWLRRFIRLSPATLGRFHLAALLPRVSPRLTALVAVLVVVTAALPLAFTFASGALIGSIPAAIADGLDSLAGQTSLRALALAGTVFILQRLIGPLRGIFASQLAHRVEDHLEERLMRAVSGPTGIAHLEDPATLDLIRNAQEIGTGQWKPIGAVTALVTVAFQWLQGFGYAAVLMGFRWWLGLGFLAVQLYTARVLRREYIRIVGVMARTTSVLRRSSYLRDLALTPPHAKEVRLFGLVDWINDRHSDE